MGTQSTDKARGIERKAVSNMEFKALEEPGTFEGVASVMGVEDLGGDIVEEGAFNKTLSENPEIPILLQHDSGEVIGQGTVSVSENKAILRGSLDMDDPTAVKTWNKMKKKLIKGLSIGFEAVKVMWEETKEGYVRHINELKLWEVSVVTFPMNPGAQVTAVKRHTASDISTDDLIRVAERERKEGRRISAATRAKIDEALTSLQALLAEQEDTSENASEAVVGEEAAAPPPEPVGDHSEVVQIPAW